jgi:hypothetical protein
METVKITVLIMILLLVNSCSRDVDRAGLKMEILNENIVYVNNSAKNYDSDIRNHEHYWKYATNTVVVKFTNTSDKPIVFCFDKNHVLPLYSKNCETGQSNFQGAKIKSSTSLSFDLISSGGNCVNEVYHKSWSNDSLMYFGRYYAAKLELDSLYVKEQLLREGATKYEIVSESFYSDFYVIYPNQVKFVEFQIALPLTDYRRDFNYRYYNLNPDNKAYAQITLTNKLDDSLIPRVIRREIKANNYTLFNGTIKSNKVHLNMVNMPEQN